MVNQLAAARGTPPVEAPREGAFPSLGIPLFVREFLRRQQRSVYADGEADAFGVGAAAEDLFLGAEGFAADFPTRSLRVVGEAAADLLVEADGFGWQQRQQQFHAEVDQDAGVVAARVE